MINLLVFECSWLAGPFCLFSMCLCGFPLRDLVFSHSLKTRMLGNIRVFGDSKLAGCEGDCVIVCLSLEALWWTGDLGVPYTPPYDSCDRHYPHHDPALNKRLRKRMPWWLTQQTHLMPNKRNQFVQGAQWESFNEWQCSTIPCPNWLN